MKNALWHPSPQLQHRELTLLEEDLSFSSFPEVLQNLCASKRRKGQRRLLPFNPFLVQQHKHQLLQTFSFNRKGILKCNAQRNIPKTDLSSYLENFESEIEVLEEMMDLSHSFLQPWRCFYMRGCGTKRNVTVLLGSFRYFRWEVLICLCFCLLQAKSALGMHTSTASFPAYVSFCTSSSNTAWRRSRGEPRTADWF